MKRISKRTMAFGLAFGVLGVGVAAMAQSGSSKVIEENDPRIEAGYRALEAFWDNVGPSDADRISYLINPQFQGKPAWPNVRQAYRIVRPANSLIIASDGLSDPFVGTDTDDVSGFGMEVFVETPDLVGANFEAIRTSWAFQVLENFAMNVADWGGITEDLRANAVLSIEFPSEGVLPSDWLTASSSAGFLINVPAKGRASGLAMPFGETMIVSLTLLRPAELTYVVENKAAGRAHVAKLLPEQGLGHMSSLKRPSVV